MVNAIEKLHLDSENELETGSVYMFYLPNLEVILSRSLSLCNRGVKMSFPRFRIHSCIYTSIVIG